MTCILASVSCVLRRQASADALQDLGQSISDFLGPDPYLSLSEACAFHSLLNWIWRNCWASNGHLGRDFKCRSVEVLLEAATSFETRPTLPKDWKGNLELAELFLPRGRKIMEFAVGCPHLDVLKMVMEAGILRLDEDGAAEMNELLVPHGRLDLTQRVFQLYSPPRPRSDGDVNWKSYGYQVSGY
ncbi:hypothetical protein PC121_g5206 [Phytophthora cactorum]|nr:hypothetical protein PC121_g5206 [Phytophthora cactorum]